MTSSESKGSRTLVILLAALAVIAAAFLLYPVYVIRPFRVQGEAELALSLLVRRWSVLVTALCAVASVLIAALVWGRAGTRGAWQIRVGALVLASLSLAASALTHINIFEKMFHPITSSQFVSTRDAKLQNSEMVLAMTIGPTQRAYPISIMAYHHILNDVLAGVPLAVTY